MYFAPHTSKRWLALSALFFGILVGTSSALAKSYSTERGLLRLHLPVHFEGDQTIRLDRLVTEHYDLDLDHYLLRGVVIESDGYRNRQHAHARLKVGRYKTARVFIDAGQTAIDAPAYRHNQWQLQLGSGARVHGLLLILEEQRYSSYRTHPNAGAALSLGWYLGNRNYRYPDFYYRDRYHYGPLANRYDPFYRSRYRHYRYQQQHRIDRHRAKLERRQQERRQARREARAGSERHEHHNARERRANREHRRERRHEREQHAEHRQWRNAGERHAGERRHQRRGERRASRPLPRQRQQVEQALRGNHEHARRPDRPMRARVESPRPQRRASSPSPRPRAQNRENRRGSMRSSQRSRTPGVQQQRAGGDKGRKKVWM